MFIPGSCDIGFLCSNMGLEANYAGSYMEVKNHDFEMQIKRHEENSKADEVVDKSS